jgi:hypothetical protein
MPYSNPQLICAFPQPVFQKCDKSSSNAVYRFRQEIDLLSCYAFDSNTTDITAVL